MKSHTINSDFFTAFLSFNRTDSKSLDEIALYDGVQENDRSRHYAGHGHPHACGWQIGILRCIQISFRNQLLQSLDSAEHILQEIKSAGFKQVGLWVFEQNIRARRFYEKHGFIARPTPELGPGMIQYILQ